MKCLFLATSNLVKYCLSPRHILHSWICPSAPSHVAYLLVFLKTQHAPGFIAQFHSFLFSFKWKVKFLTANSAVTSESVKQNNKKKYRRRAVRKNHNNNKTRRSLTLIFYSIRAFGFHFCSLQQEELRWSGLNCEGYMYRWKDRDVTNYDTS